MTIEVIPIPATSISVDGISVAKTGHRHQIERIVIVGDVYGYKRTEVAVRAVAQFAATRPGRPVTLTHIGRDRDAPATRRFEEALDEARAGGVHVIRLGVVAHDRVIEEMVAADVIVLASSIETQGLPLVEAMAVGLPVVARAIGPFVELGGDAFASVPVTGDATEFAAAIESIDQQSDRERAAIAGRALHPPGDSWELVPPT